MILNRLFSRLGWGRDGAAGAASEPEAGMIAALSRALAYALAPLLPAFLVGSALIPSRTLLEMEVPVVAVEALRLPPAGW
jgi:hypothetical protein